MDINELRECRRAAEQEIIESVTRILNAFVAKTGEGIHSLSLDYRNVVTIGGKGGSVITGCRIGINV